MVEEDIVHLPERALCRGGLRRELRVGVDVVQRKVPSFASSSSVP